MKLILISISYLFEDVWWLHRSIPVQLNTGQERNVPSGSYCQCPVHGDNPGKIDPSVSISIDRVHDL